MNVQGVVGQPSQSSISPGVSANARLGQLGDAVVSELHGRFYENAYRNNLFRAGTTSVVTLTANHGTANGLSATLATAAAGTPILGIYNPASSTVNAVLLQASLALMIQTATSPVPPGALVWAVSLGNAAISTGLVPWNSKTLAQAGSQVKAFTGGTALTGLTNVLTAIEAADFSAGSLTYGTVAITAPTPNSMQVSNLDGQIIVPPGGVLALYNTAASTTFNFTGRLLWEEVPV
jgi:hypothetical protein